MLFLSGKSPQNTHDRQERIKTSVKTTPELSGPVFGVLPRTGDEELEDRGKPG